MTNTAVGMIISFAVIGITAAAFIALQSHIDDKHRYNKVMEYRGAAIEELKQQNAELVDSIKVFNEALKSKKQKKK
jgi:hypothetical protein